jgi:transposase-like protein
MARRKAPRIPDALLDQLLAGADPKTAFDANGLLDDLKKAFAEWALNAEMNHHLAGDEAGNSRNGYGRKTATTETGRIELEIPRDRQATFDPQLIAKYQRRFLGFDDKIVSMRALAAAVPDRITIVLTDNGTHFTEPTGDGCTPQDINAMRAQGKLFRCQSFELACADLNIEHRLTKPRHPWTNGQVERMNRTIKDATVKRFYYETHDELRKHLADFVAAYNYARRLKTLRGLTSYEAICKAWGESPSQFTADPHHQLPGPNI